MFNNYTQEKLLISDPKILSIPAIDNKEELIDLKNQQIIAFGPSPEIPNNSNYTKMRKTIYDKLLIAQSLLPRDLRFCIYEAYRSLDLQQKLFKNRFNLIKNEHQNWSNEEIFLETTKLISPVVNLDGSKNIPPHSTGAAIDIYLINNKNYAVDMGIETKNWMQDIDGSISATNSSKITQEAKEYRNIMSNVLEEVGFVNYYTEYWHWSYGDKYWAYYKKEANAFYTSI